MSEPPALKSPEPSRGHVLQWLAETEGRLSWRNTTSLRHQFRTGSFKFTDDPAHYSLASPDSLDHSLQLEEGVTHNAVALTHENWLREMEEIVVSYRGQYANDHEISPRLSLLLSNLQQDRSHLDDLKRWEWERQKALVGEINQVNPGIYMMPPLATMEPKTILTYIVVLCLYLISGVSQDQCSFY
ncbi:hypothetical protein P691DRAFT_680676, partial [Macrolepiota fuliginosa MF-IS2]